MSVVSKTVAPGSAVPCSLSRKGNLDRDREPWLLDTTLGEPPLPQLLEPGVHR